MVSQKEKTQSQSLHAAGAVRHAEKRRTGTCLFADRVARVSIDAYRSYVPDSFRSAQRHTCIATIVAHFGPASADEDEGRLQVMSLGVGTKFLSESVLRREEILTNSSSLVDNERKTGYGTRVRDCHAEVLARRAFRRQLCLEIQRDMASNYENSESTSSDTMKILDRLKSAEGEDSVRYRLIPNVTLHFYSSSAPCGNATLKKFTKMEKETYNSRLGADEWPSAQHELIPPHSLRLGQFALLVKKDNSIVTNDTYHMSESLAKGKIWPANQSDEWCPPGTSIVLLKKGSLHTCSDKMCRWNCLGLQGSLLSSLFDSPLYMTTLTVGRKLTGCICRRAVCCRASPPATVTPINSTYHLNHPTIMGTGVYMDETGVIDMMESSSFGQDVRFTSSLCWAWCPLMAKAECIDGATGFVHDFEMDENESADTSAVSTSALLSLFYCISESIPQLNQLPKEHTLSLSELRSLKRSACPEYETAKDELMSRHRIFRQWRRRESEVMPE